MLFQISKLLKKEVWKAFLRILLTEWSETIFTPSFANTMLCAVFFNFKGVLALLKVSQTVKKILNLCSFALLFLPEIVFWSLIQDAKCKVGESDQ